jgi:hypothetical protein
MTLNEYSALPEAERYITLWGKGVIVAQRECGTFTAFLYQLFSFYVELYCEQITDKIIMLRSFSDTDSLEPYLEDIDVSNVC